MKRHRKGIVLAGGSGSRLYPSTFAFSKQLIPVYDKPMIYYPLSTLMLAGIREILIITTPRDLPLFQNLLGDGSQFGAEFQYVVQHKPEGLAQSLILAEDFLDGAPSCLILGDNLFYGQGLKDFLIKGIEEENGATIYAYKVANPKSFGVVEFDENRKAISIEEKPDVPKSNFAVTGLYMYDESGPERAKALVPSTRGELEITDLNRSYLEEESLNVETFGRGLAWFDTGTYDDLLEAAQFIQSIEKRQGFKVACLQEIALQQHWISRDEIINSSVYNSQGSYGEYLKFLLQEIY